MVPYPVVLYWTILMSWLGKCLMEVYFCLRQTAVYSSHANVTSLPASIRNRFTQATLWKARKEAIRNTIINIYTELHTLILLTTFLLFDGSNKAWNLAEYTVTYFDSWLDSWDEEIRLSVCIMKLYTFFSAISYLPFAFWIIFFNSRNNNELEEANQQVAGNPPSASSGVVVVILIISTLLVGISLLISPVEAWLLTKIFTLLRKGRLIYFFLFMFAWYAIWFELIGSMFFAHLSAWNIVHLRDGPLRNRIERLAARNQINFPLSAIYITESTGAPSPHFGICCACGIFGSQSIVLFGSLIPEEVIAGRRDVQLQPQQQQNAQPGGDGNVNNVLPRQNNRRIENELDGEEIEALILQEIGGWKQNFYWKWKAVSFITGLGMTFLLDYWFQSSELYAAFGFPVEEETNKPIVLGIAFAFIFLSPIYYVMTYIRNLLFRYLIFQKDAFAVEWGSRESLRRGLIKLHCRELNLEFPIEDSLYTASHGSYPTLLQHLDAIDDL